MIPSGSSPVGSEGGEWDGVDGRVSSSPLPQGSHWLGKHSGGAGVQAFLMWSHRSGGPGCAYISAPLWWFFGGGVSGRGCSGLCGWVCGIPPCAIWFHFWSQVCPGRLACFSFRVQWWIWCLYAVHWDVCENVATHPVRTARWRMYRPRSVARDKGVVGSSADEDLRGWNVLHYHLFQLLRDCII